MWRPPSPSLSNAPWLRPAGARTGRNGNLEFAGAVAAVNAAAALNRFFKKGLNVRTIGLLPVMVDRRLALTAMVLDSLKQLSADTGVPVLPVIRTDSAVPKAARVRKFLADFEPGSRPWPTQRRGFPSPEESGFRT